MVAPEWTGEHDEAPATKDGPAKLTSSSALGAFSSVPHSPSPSPAGGQALFTAVTRADLAGLRGLLEAQADPNTIDDSGETPLFEAAISGNLTMVAMLLSFGGDASRRSLDGMTARDLTNEPNILKLIDIFLHEEVPTLEGNTALAELSPRAAGEVTRRLDTMNPETTAEPPGILDMELSGFYQDSSWAELPPSPPLSPKTAVPLADRRAFPKLDFGRPAAQAHVPSERELLAEFKEIFEVVKTNRCKVFTRPDLQSAVLTSKSRGAQFFGVELTVDMWLRLLDQPDGWVLVDMRGINGIRQVLQPKRKNMNLMVIPYQPQGLCMLEVCVAEMCAHRAPREDSEVLHNYIHGEMLFGRSQNFNGWVRLVGDEGWVRPRSSAGLRTLRLIEALDESDLWALASMWAVARGASKDPLSPKMISALKEVHMDSLRSMSSKLAQCRPGSLDDYLVLGLTAEDMKRSRTEIIQRVFVIALQELLEERSLFLFEEEANLFRYERAPQLRDLAGVVECEVPDGVRVFDLGTDSTVYEPQSGRAYGLWQEEQIVPMTHLSELYSEFLDEEPEEEDVQVESEGEEFLEAPEAEELGGTEAEELEEQEGQQEEEEEEEEEEEQDARPRQLTPIRPAPTPLRGASVQDLVMRASELVDADQHEEALDVLNQALADYEAGSKVDLALECDILKFRAECWAALEDYEHVLMDTGRIVALENDEVGTQRHFFHTGHVADGHVQELRRRAFSGRREFRVLREEEPSFSDAPPIPCVQPSLADLD